ncbi:MAG: arsenate reductase [Saprospiraceae bacterium]|jgi:arsenate reductase
MKIYHNPRCSTSRKALKMITDAGIEPEIILYQKNVLTPLHLRALLRKMKMAPIDLVRKKEDLFKTVYKDKELSDEEWIQIMIEHPRLMERPIVENGNKAVLGRPLGNIEDLICK